MARLIQKTGFISRKSAGDYMKYIATREGGEVLTGKDTAYKSGCRAAVADIKNTFWRFKSVKPAALDNDRAVTVNYINTHFIKTADCGKAVCSLKKTGDFSRSTCNRTEHNGTV